MKLLLLVILIALTFSQTIKPYEFKSYERYLFSYEENFRGARNTALFEIVIRSQREGFLVSITGRYRNWEGIVERRFSHAKEVADFITMRMYFDHYWLIPLGKTIFSRGVVKALTSASLNLTPGIYEIDENTRRVVTECEEGGLKGYSIRISVKGDRVFEVCLSLQASLPIYLYRRDVEGNSYEIKLLEYSDLK